MIGIDTNVLIRYIVQDDPEQSAKAVRFIEANCSKNAPGFINSIVLCEIVWVLKRAYKYNKNLITMVLKQILITTELEIENSDCALLALHDYEKGHADFADYFIAQINRDKGCEATVTFDQKTSDCRQFTILKIIRLSGNTFL